MRGLNKGSFIRTLSNVPLPEPHLGLLAAGLLLQRARPWRLHLGSLFPRLAGWLLIAVGAGIAGWAVRAAGVTDLARSERLVTRGPFALSRHPMYMGWNLIYFGLMLVVNTCWLLILSPLLLTLVHLSSLAEERSLRMRFGQDYRAYAERVGRYL